MSALFRLFLDICLFRRGPQDTPYSVFLFAVLLIITFALDLYQLSLPIKGMESPPVYNRVLYVALSTGTLIVAIYLIMRIWNVSARFLQTITSIYGADLIISFIQVPVVILAAYIQEVTVAMLLLISLIWLVMIGWTMAVYTHIFRNALSIPVVQAGLLAIGIFSLRIMMSKYLFLADS